MANRGELIEIWAYRNDLGHVEADALVGSSVEATDGSIGKVDEATGDVGACYLIVDTGPWIFGKKVMLPAGVISRVDAAGETVQVDLSREAIKNAPPFDTGTYTNADYRDVLAAYYAANPHETARAEDRLRKTG